MEGDAFVAIAGRKAAIRLVDELLPQTQCRRCGYDDCLAYAEAIVDGAPINRCPPGGAAGIDRLAGLTGRPATALDPETGSEGPLRLAKIDEGWCIGCTLCLAACPVDCIVGAPKRMHAVVAAQCTGCELCLPVCPVDCISMVDAPAAPSPISAGRSARTDVRAAEAKERYRFHGQRLGGAAAAEAEEAASGLPPADTGPGTAAAVAAVSPDIDLQAIVEAALARKRRPPA